MINLFVSPFSTDFHVGPSKLLLQESSLGGPRRNPSQSLQSWQLRGQANDFQLMFSTYPSVKRFTSFNEEEEDFWTPLFARGSKMSALTTVRIDCGGRKGDDRRRQLDEEAEVQGAAEEVN